MVLAQFLAQRIAIIGQVANQSFRRSRAAALHREFYKLGFVRRSAGHVHGDRKTMAVYNAMAVCNCHDLGPFAALRLTNAKAPFWASMRKRRSGLLPGSSLPRSFKSCSSNRRSPSTDRSLPSPETPLTCRVRSIAFGQVLPGISSAQNPESNV